MAESPAFNGFNMGDAAESFAKMTAQMRSDMAAIEASAKNIEKSLTGAAASGGKVSGPKGGAGNTGVADQTGMKLGDISGKKYAVAGAVGSMAGLVTGGGLSGMAAGGIALAGMPELMPTAERALNMENAQFGMAQATGDFGTFGRMMRVAKNDFNVQDQKAFMNTLVTGTQRMGMVGLMGGGEMGERRAAAQIGGYSTLAGLAGIDQSRVPGAMQTMNGAPAYYSAMASGIMTRDPRTGQLVGVEGQVNQLWNNAGIEGMSEEDALTQIDINYGAGSAGRYGLEQMYQGDQAAVEMAIEGLRIRARQDGKALSENQLQEQMKDIGERGGLNTKYTQGNEGTRALESSKLGLVEEYLLDATAGIEEATKHIKNAADALTELEGPARTMAGHFVSITTALDVFESELPKMTSGLTGFFGDIASKFSGLPAIIAGAVLARALPAVAGVAAPVVAAVAAPLAAGTLAAGGVAALGFGAKWAVEHFTDYDERMGTPGAGKAAEAIADAGSSRYQGSSGGYPTMSKGDWFVEADQDGRVHYGEMILPARVAQAVRDELALGKTSAPASRGGGGGTTVNINLTVQRATDQEAIYFANKVKRLIDSDAELHAIGQGW